MVLQSLDLVRPEDVGRRLVMLVNPKRRDASAAVGWLYTGIQVMKPDEAASAHRHIASAPRFIIEGSGAYTIVDAERLTLVRGVGARSRAFRRAASNGASTFLSLSK